MSSEFMDALAANLPEDERMILCGFGGDPNTAPSNAWTPRPWRPGEPSDLGRGWNGYTTVGSFRKAQDGSFRRRTETFAAGRALMVDDVGTKVDPSVVAAMPPTARVLTSPGNEQWWYFLDVPERDASRFDGVIRAFISGKLLGADPGMSGITRVGRIPGFYNCKAAYGGSFKVELQELNQKRYAVEELLAGFGLEIRGRRVSQVRLHSDEAVERNRNFATVYKWLAQHDMLKRDEPDLSGWTEMTCINVENHTAKADTGAAIREPAEDNGYYGAAKCHHGGCTHINWRELTEWVAEQSAEELEGINASCHDDK